MPDEKIIVHFAEIHHRHGTDFLLGWTKEQVIDQVYEYVEEWWGEWDYPEESPPKDKMKAIDLYFDGEHNEEWCDISWMEMPPKPE